MVITAAASMWLTPLSIRQTYKVLNKLIAAQLTAEIQPRVFAEQFPDTILYVGGVDATPGSVVRWRNVFLADISAPDKRKKTGSEMQATVRGSRPRVRPSLFRISNVIAFSFRSLTAARTRSGTTIPSTTRLPHHVVSKCWKQRKAERSAAADPVHNYGHGAAGEKPTSS